MPLDGSSDAWDTTLCEEMRNTTVVRSCTAILYSRPASWGIRKHSCIQKGGCMTDEFRTLMRASQILPAVLLCAVASAWGQSLPALPAEGDYSAPSLRAYQDQLRAAFAGQDRDVPLDVKAEFYEWV